MPRYDYRCEGCDAVVELTSTFAEADAARACEGCGASLQRMVMSTPPTLIMDYSERFLNKSETPSPRPGLQSARRYRHDGEKVVEV